MNAQLANTQPLPPILMQANLEQAQPRPGRRHRIGDYDIDPVRLQHFNALLTSLDSARPPLDCDRLATAARELCDRSIATPACIGQRMRRVAAAALMVADPAWRAANDALEAAGLVIAYVRDANDLIPDRLPRVGRLDDAIVVETAWPRLADEVASYIDFRRLLRLEAALRGDDGDTGLHFGRDDWEQARRAEALLAAHRQRVFTGSYLSSPPAVFRVH